MEIHILETAEKLGEQAAALAHDHILSTLKEKGNTNIILATGVSQFHMLEHLTSYADIDWSKVRMLGFEEALLATSKMASENPARQLQLFDTIDEKPGTGRLEIGKWADLIIGEIQEEKGDYNLVIDQLFLMGKRIALA